MIEHVGGRRSRRANKGVRRVPARQRGVAVVTALLVTALAVTMVTGMFWQQQVQVRGMEGARLHLQARLIARAAVDAARLTLRDAAAAQGNVTTLDGAWNVPLVETGLARYLGHEAGDGQADDGEPAGQAGALQQRIVDAQSRFNLNNLAQAQKINPFQVAAFARLLATLQLDPALALATAQAVARTSAPGAPAARQPLTSELTAPAGGMRGAQIALLQLDDLLSVPGYSTAVLARLRDFVVVLPEPTAINVNTAPAEVLTSVANLSLLDAQMLVARRQQAYFKDASDFAFRLNDKETLEGVNFQVSSDYFLVASQLHLAAGNLAMQALIRRRGERVPATTLLWMREI